MHISSEQGYRHGASRFLLFATCSITDAASPRKTTDQGRSMVLALVALGYLLLRLRPRPGMMQASYF
jgi:hypothetical protein